MLNVLIWNENHHDTHDEKCMSIYPDGMHGTIKAFLECDDIKVTCVTMDMENCGLSKELLAENDVLIWWGHMAHHKVPDEIAAMVHERVLGGMGFIALHSAHHSKPFRRLMGTSCNLQWRDGDRCRVWCTAPSHPIAKGVPNGFLIEREEMYGEPFAIPNPDEVVFISAFSGGEAFRSGVTYRREHGKIFYFQPGHESNPTFHNPIVQTIIKNAVRWAAPDFKLPPINCPHVPAMGF